MSIQGEDMRGEARWRKTSRDRNIRKLGGYLAALNVHGGSLSIHAPISTDVWTESEQSANHDKDRGSSSMKTQSSRSGQVLRMSHLIRSTDRDLIMSIKGMT
jgi:hypothetical protein